MAILNEQSGKSYGRCLTDISAYTRSEDFMQLFLGEQRAGVAAAGAFEPEFHKL